MIKRRLLVLIGSFDVKLENNETRLVREFHTNELEIDINNGIMYSNDEEFFGITYINTENEDNIHVMYSDEKFSAEVMID